MSEGIRPRRSALYMPGSNARALAKSKTLAADVLILDLEDAVAPDAKEAARRQVCAALAEGGYGRRQVLVRVNAAETPWGDDDLAAAAAAAAHAVLLPKVESADAVRRAKARAADVAVWCMIETPRGVLAAAEIAAVADGLVMGTSDLAKDLRCAHTPDREPMITSLGLCLLAARAAGVPILDGVYLDLDDAEGFAAACRQGAGLGFDGKTLIHPKQIEAANRAFAPTAEDVDRARRVIAAHAEAERGGRGVVLVDGRLVETLHVAEARRVVATSRTIAEMEGRRAET